jgi:hypothetical protein
MNLGGSGEERGAPGPVPIRVAAQSQPGLMHQGSRLDGLAGPFIRHLAGGQAPEFFVPSATTARRLFDRQGQWHRAVGNVAGHAVQNTAFPNPGPVPLLQGSLLL